MYKIAVLGEKDSVIGFSALGLDTYSATSEQEAKEIFHKLTKNVEEYAIIYVTENFYEILASDINKFKDNVTPAIILIPGSSGSLGLGQSALNAAVERAIGANIL